MKITKNLLNKILLFLLIFVSVLLPAKSFGLKQIFLGALLVFNIKTILTGISNSVFLKIFSVFLPIWMFSISVISGGNVSDSIKYVYIFTFLWIPLIAKASKINLDKVFINVVILVAFVIDMFVIFHSFKILPLENNIFAQWLNSTNNAQLSYTDDAIFYYVFYLNACPLLFFPLIDAMKEKKILNFFIVVFAILFSGTRANIYLLLVVVLAYAVVYEKYTYRRYCILFLILAMLCMLLPFIISFISDKIDTINSVKSFGDNIRRERTFSAIRLIFDDFKIFTIGMGAGVPFYANGILNFGSEVSYIELWRVSGLFSLFFMSLLLISLLVKTIKNPVVISYVAYLTVCFVDPFLMTSTGFLMIMYMFNLNYKNEESIYG